MNMEAAGLMFRASGSYAEGLGFGFDYRTNTFPDFFFFTSIYRAGVRFVLS